MCPSPRSGLAIDDRSDARKNMRLVLHSYQPNVVCLTQTIAYDIQESCQSLLDTMHISDTKIKFGYERDSTVRMPYTRVSGELLSRHLTFCSGL